LSVGSTEKFELVPAGRSGYHIKTRLGTWLTLIDDGYKVAARAISKLAVNQTFFIKQVADSGTAVSIMTARGKYVCAHPDGAISAARDEIGEFEVFGIR
jgi:hypothetical protein